MNKKLQRLVEPGMRLFLFFLVVFAAVTYFFDVRLALAEGAVILLLLIYSLMNARARQKELLAYIETVTYNAESAANNTLIHFPLPMAVFKLNDTGIVWANQPFWEMCGRSGPAFDANISGFVPEFSNKWLLEGKSQHPGLLSVRDRKYLVNGNMVRSGKDGEYRDFMGITYWVDMTESEKMKQEYQDSRPVVAVIILDNYDELTKKVPERTRNELRNAVSERIEHWSEGKGGLLRSTDRDRTLFIFEARHLSGYIADKFSLIDAVHEVTSPTGIHATVSIGIGMDGGSLEETQNFAALAVEMALSRGGDQAVIKNRFNFEFYGGRGSEVETRTKVKSRVIANSLYELIGDASNVLVMGHRYSDLDTIGAAAGICCIARKRGRAAWVVFNEEESAALPLVKTLQTAEEYKESFISAQDAILKADTKTLLVVVDTNRPEQVEDEDLLMASNRLAVIDHHRRASSYIQNATLTLYEPYASSVCELMSELLQELVEQTDILRVEADAMLAGIVLDTKNFTIRTGERTFDAAAFLRRAGADPIEVKKLFQNEMDKTMERYDILRQAKLYHGIAIAATEDMKDRVVAAQAADELLNISGVLASIVAFPTEDGSVNVSARSIGDMNVQVLLEKLGGGGNKSAAGVQLKDISLRDAVNKIFRAIDEYQMG